jgi:subtilase family serine protease
MGLNVATYYIIAKADADNAVVESNETNNTSARAIAIGPDLTLSSVSIPFTITAGAAVSITDTVLNQGGDAAGPSTTRYYLSTNVFFDSSDTLLSGGRAVPALGPGISSTGSASITIPVATAPGIYYVVVVADGDHVVAESQEGNNIAVRAVQVVAAP